MFCFILFILLKTVWAMSYQSFLLYIYLKQFKANGSCTQIHFNKQSSIRSALKQQL